MTAMPAVDLREAWSDLLTRRVVVRDALAVYGELVELWASVTAPAVLDLDAEACRRHWSRGEPIVTNPAFSLDREIVEPVLGPVLDVVGSIRADAVASLDAFAAAWNRGDLGPDALLPARGRIGRDHGRHDVAEDVLGSLAVGGLRPLLEPAFAECRAHLTPDDWRLGVCPFCGA